MFNLLEPLERIKDNLAEFVSDEYGYDDYVNDIDLLEKVLKSLEIIIVKEVNVQAFIICLSFDWAYELFEDSCADNDEYCENPPYRHSMTMTQFDLLKEVLLLCLE